MRAILIDPEKKTLTETQWDGGLKDLYIKTETDIVEAVSTPESKDFNIYVDEEGLFKEDKHFFLLRGFHQPLAGKGLMVGPLDSEGNDTELKISLSDAKEFIGFEE